MTALAGFWSFDGRDPLAPCRRMLKAQAIYGRASADWTEGIVAIGRHLFPTLAEDRFDRGPVSAREGKLSLVGDVRIDNRPEIEAALGIARESAGTISDATLLLRALDRWEESALDRVVGDFAFALWDADRQRLTLARDPLGNRPLHFHRGKDFFAFASMPKGLHALPDVPYAVNETVALDWLALMPEAASNTIFEGVDRVKGGEIVTVTRNGLSARVYWTPSTEPLRLADAGEYQAAMREHLDTATAARLRGADGRVGAHLSAGLDSSAVAATAARLMQASGGRVTAFTAVPREGYDGAWEPNTIGDEGPLAAATAALHPNIDHILVRTTGRSPLEGLDRHLLLYDSPVLNLCNANWIEAINEEARGRGLRILLTGSMGNMTFSYSGMEHLPELLAKGRLLRLGRLAAGLYGNGMRAGTIAAQTIGPFLPRSIWRGIGRLRGAGKGLSAYSLANVDEQAFQERASAHGLDLSYRPRRDSIETRLWVLRRTDFGTYNKGVLGGWGIDQRDATGDRRLLEFCLRVPMEQYLRGGTSRALAREGLADRLPAAVLREPLKGRQASDWHEELSADRERLREEAERIASCAPAARALDAERLRRLVEDWPEGGWGSKQVVQDYRLALLRGVSAGHFIRKVTGAN